METQESLAETQEHELNELSVEDNVAHGEFDSDVESEIGEEVIEPVESETVETETEAELSSVDAEPTVELYQEPEPTDDVEKEEKEH